MCGGSFLLNIYDRKDGRNLKGILVKEIFRKEEGLVRTQRRACVVMLA
jgi:hypothetical protein